MGIWVTPLEEGLEVLRSRTAVGRREPAQAQEARGSQGKTPWRHKGLRLSLREGSYRAGMLKIPIVPETYDLLP